MARNRRTSNSANYTATLASSSSLLDEPLLMSTPDESCESNMDITATMPPVQQQQAPRCLRDAAYEYFFRSPRELWELVFCFFIFAFGKLLPLLWNLWYHWESPVPYQTTANGDILLELDLSYELLRKETIPDWLAAVLCVIIPLLLYSIIGFYWGPDGDVHASLCFFFVTVGLTWLLTDTIKTYAGQLRPNFYDMCEFNKDTLECETDSKHLLQESRRSFPSGHSSLAFGSMMTLSLYFLGKVGIQRNMYSQVPSFRSKILYLLSSLPLLLAFFIATSRIHDFWHHPADVVGGALIGVACALFSHGMWYVKDIWMLNR